MHPAPTRVDSLVASSARRFAARARAAGIEVVVDVVPDLVVEVDERRVAQAIDNLLDNAIRHARSRVTVAACSGDGARDGVTIRVCYDGPGFDEGLALRAFEPFAHGTAGDGSGLGLTIVALVAAAHGGAAAITLPSTFAMSLPG